MLFIYVNLDSKSLFRRVIDLLVSISTDDEILFLSPEKEFIEVVVSIFSGTIEDTKLNKSTITTFMIFKFTLLNVNRLVYVKHIYIYFFSS